MGQELDVLKSHKKHVTVFPCVYLCWSYGDKGDFLAPFPVCTTTVPYRVGLLCALMVVKVQCSWTASLHGSHALGQ